MAMRRPEDFQDSEVWLMVKLGDTTLPVGETTSSKIGCRGTRGGTHSRMRGLRYGPHDQGAKITTHSRQIGNQWDVQAPTGRMGEAGTNRPQSVIGTRRV